jgi:hypothetical protein
VQCVPQAQRLGLRWQIHPIEHWLLLRQMRGPLQYENYVVC